MIESLSHEGRGIARVGGKTMFVEGALPGERVRARCLQVHRRYDEAWAEAVLAAAPERVTPPCAHYGICGGCSLQHLDRTAQLRHKESIVLEQLRHAGGVAPRRVLPPLESPGTGYRHRARLSVRYVPARRAVRVGFRERYSSHVAGIMRCEVLHPRAAALVPALPALVGALTVAAAVPQIEVAVSDADCALVLRHLRPLADADLALLREFGRAHAVHWFLQPGGEDTVAPLDPTPPPRLVYALPAHRIEIAFGPTEFTQVNFHINRALVQTVVGMLDPHPPERVLDLFCGVGNFSLPLARRAGSVTGVEGLARLVARARDNAARNGIANADFIAADLAREDLAAPFLGQRWDKVLLDPPRAGAYEVLARLDHAPVRTLVYVSCNPATLARDAALLVNRGGYVLEEAGIVDMFPHTAHVECLARFSR
jgi:23S rRNA (uracil1939-C5)-methyltransferase